MGEQPTGGVEIDRDLRGETRLQKLGRFVVNGAAAQIDGFEPGSARAMKGVGVAIADQDVILQDPSKGAERQIVTDGGRSVLGSDMEGQLCVRQCQGETIGSPMVTDWDEAVVLQEVVNGE